MLWGGRFTFYGFFVFVLLPLIVHLFILSVLCHDGFVTAPRANPNRSGPVQAPEIVNKTGHDTLADYWSLGALLYDMTTGGPPFTATNRYKLIEQIKVAELPVPAKLSRNLVLLIGGLMNRSVQHRLGSDTKGGTEALKRHKWFDSVDWYVPVNLWTRFEPPKKVLVPVDESFRGLVLSRALCALIRRRRRRRWPLCPPAAAGLCHFCLFCV